MHLILASLVANVIESANLGPLWWRDFLRHVTADLIKEKLTMHLIHVIVVEYGVLSLLQSYQPDVHKIPL